MDNICTQNYGSPFKEIFDQLHEPTVSTKSNRQVQQTAKRQLLRDTRDEIQNQMNANAADIGMGARLSWKTYDTMRTTLGLEKDAVLSTREDAKIKKHMVTKKTTSNRT